MGAPLLKKISVQSAEIGSDTHDLSLTTTLISCVCDEILTICVLEL